MAALTLLVVVLLSACEAQLTAEEKTLLLDLHNAGRRNPSPPAADMKKLVWDESIAQAAQAYADTCPSYHSSTNYGENLAWGWPSRTAQNAMIGWYDEEKVLYNFVNNTCSGVCGHYTQVVWAATSKVGCGKKFCSSFVRFLEYGSGHVYVCQYSTAGNVNQNRPYIPGTPCSHCPAGFPYCDDGLCSAVAPICSSSPCKNGGICTGTNGGSTFSCDCTGTGYFGPTCSYRVACPAISSDDNASWQQALSGTLSWGACKPGYLGQPSRLCQNNGTFGPIINPCLPVTATCPSDVYANANWPATLITAQANGTCVSGFVGQPLRRCKVTGVWETLVQGVGCTRFSGCLAESGAGGATWPQTAAGGLAQGVCQGGTTGTPTRTCSASGVWGAVTNPCVATTSCPAELYVRANWPSTPAGGNATGACISGWTGSPFRICKPTGVWQDLVSNHCIRI